ncbi:MAG: cell envelope integrity protein CreD [Gammaproteobacteria bacterium]|nr:cell envelope integrity protein CreD [Gammaproteobacteria bacterium]
MQTIVSRLRQSASVKVFVIGLLILLLLIPLGMIRETINDREQIHQAARYDIQRTWGLSQLIAGPVLVLPYDVVYVDGRGDRFSQRSEIYILPGELNIDAAVDSEIRYRGIHKVPVYSASVRLHGRFAAMDTVDLGIEEVSIHWEDASVVIGISDGRAIAETPSLEVNGDSVTFVPGGQLVDGFPPQIQAPLRQLLETDRAGDLVFDIVLNIKGSESLSFLPLGDTTRASIRSAWPSPSFSGNYLPHTREIADDGFTANWQISSIGRSLPSRWAKTSGADVSPQSAVFGVDLYMPIRIYRLTLRAVTYGVLFVVLTFVAYFMFETIVGLRLHPLQYLMVGLANVIFFLLLISLAEHIGFGWSYLASAFASSGLIVAYSYNVLGQRGRAVIVGGVLFALYCFLYMTLKAETYALLAGSIGLWATLAMIMYLTRRIDWYRRSDPSDDDRQKDFLEA